MTKDDVAVWMIGQIRERGRVSGSELAAEAAGRFGEECVVRTAARIRFSESVLAAFRRTHAGSVRWQQDYWESVG